VTSRHGTAQHNSSENYQPTTTDNDAILNTAPDAPDVSNTATPPPTTDYSNDNNTKHQTRTKSSSVAGRRSSERRSRSGQDLDSDGGDSECYGRSLLVLAVRHNEYSQ